jgi:hypothetical protein
MAEYVSKIDQIQSTFKKRKFTIEVPESEFPEIIITVPDSWPKILLAPWYDVHRGHALHDDTIFKKHRKWFIDEPYVLGWNGGDFIENVVEGSPGIYSQTEYPGAQFDHAAEILAPLQHKLMFAIPGNHESRTFRTAGFDIARHLADDLKLPYFSDYCFCTIRWRGMKFRICAHHGTGAAASPGGQRNAARKDLPWVGADMYVTGHLHQPIADVVYRADYDQATDRMVKRSSVVIICPSYLNYFGGYGAAKRLGPGELGLTVAELQTTGNIEVKVHAGGRRL